MREKKTIKDCQIPIFGFHCVARNMEGWLNFKTLLLVYSQIWLNFPMDNPHIGYKEKFPKKHRVTKLVERTALIVQVAARPFFPPTDISVPQCLCILCHVTFLPAWVLRRGAVRTQSWQMRHMCSFPIGQLRNNCSFCTWAS